MGLRHRIPNQKPIHGSQIDWKHPIAQGLVGCLLINENTGSIFNIAGDRNIGVLKSGAHWSSDQNGSIISFDGDDDYIDISHSNSLSITGDFTLILGGLKSLGLISGNAGLLSKSSDVQKYFGSSSQKVYEVGILSDVLYFQTSTGAASDALSYANYHLIIEDGSTHTLACVYDIGIANGQKIFSDGVEIAQRTPVNTSVQALSYFLDIGGYTTAWNYRGQISYVYIYQRALLAAEISQLNLKPFCFIKKPQNMALRWLGTGVVYEDIVSAIFSKTLSTSSIVRDLVLASGVSSRTLTSLDMTAIRSIATAIASKTIASVDLTKGPDIAATAISKTVTSSDLLRYRGLIANAIAKTLSESDLSLAGAVEIGSAISAISLMLADMVVTRSLEGNVIGNTSTYSDLVRYKEFSLGIASKTLVVSDLSSGAVQDLISAISSKTVTAQELTRLYSLESQAQGITLSESDLARYRVLASGVQAVTLTDVSFNILVDIVGQAIGKSLTSSDIQKSKEIASAIIASTNSYSALQLAYSLNASLQAVSLVIAALSLLDEATVGTIINPTIESSTVIRLLESATTIRKIENN